MLEGAETFEVMRNLPALGLKAGDVLVVKREADGSGGIILTRSLPFSVVRGLLRAAADGGLRAKGGEAKEDEGRAPVLPLYPDDHSGDMPPH